MKNRLVDFVLASPERLAMPLGIYAGVELAKQSVREAVSDPKIQFESQIAWRERYHIPFLQTAMDMTVEAEIFGAQLDYTENEMPIIPGRLITRREELSALIDPKVGHKRTTVPLSVVQWLKEKYAGDEVFVLGGMSGPYTLAAHLYGISETLALHRTDPALLKDLLEIANRFLMRYAWAFREVGADGVILSEPAAGLIPPEAAAEFSSPYVRRVIDYVQNEQFAFIYHNCRANLAHLPAILQSGAAVYHFGAPMDLPAALAAVDQDTILSSNLDPVEIFLNGSPDLVAAKTSELLQATAGQANFLLSAGCQLLPGTPIANVDAFFGAVARYNQTKG